MSIGFRHEYNTSSKIGNNTNQFTYSDAVKAKIRLDRQKATTLPQQQGANATTQHQPSKRELPGDYKPFWIGNPDGQKRSVSFQPLQEWEGYVLEIGAEVFSARLVDRTARQKLEEEVGEFPVSDLSEADLKLLRPGAVFRWVIGYQRSLGGTKRRVSQLVFRRMAAWNKRDLHNAQKRAADLFQGIDWE